MVNYPEKETSITSARSKVREFEDAWNTRNPEVVSLYCAEDSLWQDKGRVILGRQEIVSFLTGKWKQELHFRHMKELWSVQRNLLTIRVASEWRTLHNNWYRTSGTEIWELSDAGLLQKRIICAIDTQISSDERLFWWPFGRRPDGHLNLSQLHL
ncbi:hypothetical protein SAMN05444141_11348 [Pseudovibrio denitrificans]|uniref:SnoaL-like domain-containing protein n=1 Tax=Pseudovibrio denitrificans TaxID=258256 RepID=A0A1I7DYU5_9HYPH|nr:DUF1348 family protein [Pseudovibrio denitrificans]SFU16857.1 hypothetical protein SAMN05444141_11348 [Pseudovibrio denitrificans]